MTSRRASSAASAPAINAEDLKIQVVAIGDVTPYPGNPRRNEATIKKVMRSIREVGFQQPIVVDPENVVVAGHARLEASKRLGLERVPVVVITGKTPEQIAAYRLMDNRSHEETLWDDDLLAHEIELLTSAGVDPLLTGFDEDEIARLLGEPAAAAEAPEQSDINFKARRKARELVIVFPDVASRSAALKRLGFPDDECRLDAAEVELRSRVGKSAPKSGRNPH
jgi:ParB-like chromosome segregation protein Spo0J